MTFFAIIIIECLIIILEIKDTVLEKEKNHKKINFSIISTE